MLLASLVLLALVGACVWNIWTTAQSGLDTFVSPNAIDVKHQVQGFNVEHLTFRYDGSIHDEHVRLTNIALQGGWETSHALNQCSRYCAPYKATYFYIRRSWFGTLREIVVVDQSGNGPYAVSVTFRRCVMLPRVGCWPQ